MALVKENEEGSEILVKKEETHHQKPSKNTPFCS